MVFIYKITNTINDKVYVGQTTQSIIRRFSRHKSHANESRNDNIVLYRAFKKYGFDNFKIEIIEELQPTLLCEREQYWITELNSLVPNGYNMLSGGVLMYGSNNPFYGRTHTASSKLCMSELASKRIGELNPFYGRTHTNETKEKIIKGNAEVHNKKKDTEEYQQYKEYMRQINIDNNPFKGKTHTDKTKHEWSIKRRSKNITATSNDGISVFFDDIELAIDYVIQHKLTRPTSKRSSIRSKIRDGINHNLYIYGNNWAKE